MEIISKNVLNKIQKKKCIKNVWMDGYDVCSDNSFWVLLPYIHSHTYLEDIWEGYLIINIGGLMHH